MSQRSNPVIIVIVIVFAFILLIRTSAPMSTVNAQIIISYMDTTIPNLVVDTSNGRVSLAVAQLGSQSAISNIRFIVKASPSWQGGLASISGVSWTVGGLVKVDGAYKIAITGSGPASITNGQTYSVSTTDISGTTLNGWIPLDYKTHTLSISADVYCDFTPPGESSKEISGSVTGDIGLNNIGFPAVLSVTLDKQIS